MKRREFLKYTGLLGAGALLPLAPSMRLFAAEDTYSGPLWITIDARGGWDPTSLCDPKGYTDPADATRLNNYPTSAIQTIGNFSVAPPPDSFLGTPTPYNANTFFAKYANELLVINGIDVKTNAHADGMRHCWSGEQGRSGYPNFGALVSGSLASARPLPFLTNGGYSDGGGLVTPVRINSSGLAALSEIAYPNRSRSAGNPASPTYFADEVVNLIRQTSAARLDKLESSQNLPRIKAALNILKTSRTSNINLQNFVDDLGSANLKLASDFSSNSVYQMYLQGSVALSAYTTGATAAAHISLSGFDTHSDHDQRHYPRLMELLEGIDAIVQAAIDRNLRDQIVVMIASDFGRTNKYNDGNGKDHWPITSMMFMGNSKQVIAGNRVIGTTSSAHKANNINPTTLEPDDNGVRITPAHIHRALRKLAGVDTLPVAINDFILQGEDIDFFS